MTLPTPFLPAQAVCCMAGSLSAAAPPAFAEDQLAAPEAETASLGERYNEETDYTAWSPTFQRGFHDPKRFGIVEFAP